MRERSDRKRKREREGERERARWTERERAGSSQSHCSITYVIDASFEKIVDVGRKDRHSDDGSSINVGERSWERLNNRCVSIDVKLQVRAVVCNSIECPYTRSLIIKRGQSRNI